MAEDGRHGSSRVRTRISTGAGSVSSRSARMRRIVTISGQPRSRCSIGVVGRYPASLRWLPKWAAQKNFWIRRTAVLAQHDQLKRGAGDWPLFTRLADTMLDEKEFFIRKAIGWVLRETSKKRPKLVYDYIRSRCDRMSGLTLREGAKYLSDTQRRALGLAPWRDREASPTDRLALWRASAT